MRSVNKPSSIRPQVHGETSCGDGAKSADQSASFDFYAVGEPHPYKDALPRQQGMLAQYTPSGIILNLLLRDCSRTDVRAFQTDESKFGLLPLSGGYVWLMRDGVAAWDAPYSPGIELPDNRELPWRDDEHAPETRASIVLILADDRLVVRAMKMVSVSPELTRRLETLHARALGEPPANQAAWDAEMQRYFRAYPDPRKAFRHLQGRRLTAPRGARLMRAPFPFASVYVTSKETRHEHL